jgi:hypothetical protein
VNWPPGAPQSHATRPTGTRRRADHRLKQPSAALHDSGGIADDDDHAPYWSTIGPDLGGLLADLLAIERGTRVQKTGFTFAEDDLEDVSVRDDPALRVGTGRMSMLT